MASADEDAIIRRDRQGQDRLLVPWQNSEKLVKSIPDCNTAVAAHSSYQRAIGTDDDLSPA